MSEKRKYRVNGTKVERLKEAAHMSFIGMSDAEIGEKFGKSSRTIANWRTTGAWQEEMEALALEHAKQRAETRSETHKKRLAGYLNLIERSAAQNIKTALKLQETVNELLEEIAAGQAKIKKKKEYTLDDLHKLAQMPRQISAAINDAYAGLADAAGINKVLDVLEKTDG